MATVNLSPLFNGQTGTYQQKALKKEIKYKQEEKTKLKDIGK